MRAEEQRALTDLARDAIDPGDQSPHRQVQSSINQQLRETGQKAFSDNPAAARTFDKSMAAIGFSNDQVLKQLEQAFAATPSRRATSSDLSLLRSAVVRAVDGPSNVEEALARIEALLTREPEADRSQTSWALALKMTSDWLKLRARNNDLLRQSAANKNSSTDVTTSPTRAEATSGTSITSLGATAVDDHAGARLVAIDALGPASRSGFRTGDVVIAYNGRPVGNSAELQQMSVNTSPGSLIPIRVRRNGETKFLIVTVR